MNTALWLLRCLLLLLPFSLCAQPAPISLRQKHTLSAQHMLVSVDSLGMASAQQMFLQERNGYFHLLSRTRGLDPSLVYWVKLRVHNPEGSPFAGILELGDAFQGRIELFERLPSGIICRRAGAMVPWHLRDLPTSLPTVKLVVPAGHTRTLLLRYDNRAIDFPVDITPRIKSVEDWNHTTLFQKRLKGGLLGMLMLVAGSALLVLLRTRQLVAWGILGVSISTILHMMSTEHVLLMWLPMEWVPHFNYVFMDLTRGGVWLFGMLIVRGMLPRTPRTAQLHFGLGLVQDAVLVLLLTVGVLIWWAGSFGLADGLLLVLDLSLTALMTALSVYGFRQGGRARAFAYAMAFVVCSGVMALLVPLSWRETVIDLSLVVYAIGLLALLGRWYMEERKEQQLLYRSNLLQAEENERLQQELSSQLQYKVEDRMRELEAQHAALEQQGEQLLALNRELQERHVAMEQTHAQLLEQSEQRYLQREQLAEKNQQLKQLLAQVQQAEALAQQQTGYARDMQARLLSGEVQLGKLFPERMFFERPKDQVSGDFLWVHADGPYRYVAVADCIGHGVAGGLMSIMGHALLEDILKRKRLSEPSRILSQLCEDLGKRLREQEQADMAGMDMALCRVRELPDGQMEVCFAGAKRPLAYCLPGASIRLLPGVRRAVGGVQRHHRPFQSETLQLPKGTALYMFSDGFSDQCCPDRKRFGTARLLQQLETYAQLPMNKQGRLLEAALQEFQQEAEQRDDIMVVGLRL